VPVEWNWTPAEFLEHLCDKAGLERGAWRDRSARLFAFQSQVFREREPRGEVEEIDLTKHQACKN
jgi:AMMECR1 domain-containing protein